MRRSILIAILLTCANAFGAPEDGPLARCMKADGSRPGRLACYSNRLAALEHEQKKLVEQIQHALSDPPPEAVDYELAKVNLSKAQAAWAKFYVADCQFGANVFGGGNGGAEQELDCNVRHFETRNNDLKKLYRDFLSR